MVTELKLSDEKVGTPRRPSRFDNALKEYVDLDPYEVFLNRLHDRKTQGYGDNATTTQSLFLRHSEIAEDAELYHRNYLEYLESCWSAHLSITITPDILWFTALNELVSLVKESPEPYRRLFTDSHEKKEITVLTGDPVVMPLNRLVAALREQIPTEATRFMPDFSTTTQAAKHAMYASFCDLCSPYYNYSMMLCAFPAIQIQGTEDDWKSLGAQWKGLKPLFTSVGAWFDEVQEIFNNCAANLEKSAWWKQIFLLEKCGSGGQTVVGGWFANLFREKPSLAFTSNFPTNVASVEYTYIDTKTDYKMQDGLFFSRQKGDFMFPEFGYTVHEKMKEAVVTKG